MVLQLGDAPAPLAQSRVEATTFCFYEEAAPAGKFAKEHASGITTTTFDVADLAALRSAIACRGTLRRMLAEIPQLRWLRLTEDEWDAVVPGGLVPEIVGAAHRGDGFTFFFTLEVHRRVIYDERALLMASKERLASMAPGDMNDCPICWDGLERECAVELPGCEHGFHWRCISMWFSTARTCPVCRGDVWHSALPE
ncbi:unnamed protein product [Alopecurus aequalis]